MSNKSKQEQVLEKITKQDVDLGAQLRESDAPLSTLKTIHSVLNETLGAGHDPKIFVKDLARDIYTRNITGRAIPKTARALSRVMLSAIAGSPDQKYLIETMQAGLSDKTITLKELETMMPIIEKSGKAGHKTNPLATTLIAGLRSKSIPKEHFKECAEILRETLERTAKEGHNPYPLSRVLMGGLEGNVLNRKNLRSVAEAARKSLETCEKEGQYAHPLAETLSAGLKSKSLTPNTITPSAKEIRRIIETGNPETSERTLLQGALETAFKDRSFRHREVAALAPLVEKMSGFGMDSSLLLSDMSRKIKTGELTRSNLRMMVPKLEAAASSGYRPHYLTRPLISGLSSGALTPKTLKKSTEVLGKSLEEAKKSGYSPEYLSEVIESGLGSKVITHRNLKEATEEVGRELEESKKRPEDLEYYAKFLKRGFETKKIDHVVLRQQNLLRQEVPTKWSHRKIFGNAIKTKGVPRRRVAAYQRMLMREGHYPNAGLVEEFHKAHVKSMRRHK